MTDPILLSLNATSIALVQLVLLVQTFVGLPTEYVLFRQCTDPRSGLGEWLNRKRWQHLFSVRLLPLLINTR